MKRVYTTTCRFNPSGESREYLEEYQKFYSDVYRSMYRDMVNGFADTFEIASHYVSYICQKFGILTRIANAMHRDITGRLNAYRELKLFEKDNLNRKIDALAEKINKSKETIVELKPKVADNRATKKELNRYRKKKRWLYFAMNRFDRWKTKLKKLESDIANDRISICFGTKKLFYKQFRLKENGYKSHDEWKRDFQKARDSGMFFLGRSEETCGNQICQIHESENGFKLVLLKDKPFRTDPNKLEFVEFDGLNFPFLTEELVRATNIQAVTCRLSRKKNSWYLSASFSMDIQTVTFADFGVTAIDFNSGFLEVIETNESGNLVKIKHIPLNYHGKGNAGRSELMQVVAQIVKDSRESRKSIVIENLDFCKKKSITLKAKGKKGKDYNRMIHQLDYGRYNEIIENSCMKYGVELIKTNAAYTSYIGKEKYAPARKLTVHQAAALVIGRRGQGFKENFVIKKKNKNLAKAA